MFTILAEGNWSRSQVKTGWTASTRASDVNVDRQIEAEWEKTASRAGIHLFDGPMCRLESYSANREELSLKLSETSYKIFLGTNLAGAEKFPPNVCANPVGLSAALITGDEQLVLGRRSARVAYYPSRVHPFAGALEPKDGADVFAGILRELEEELGLSDIDSIHCIGLAEDDSLRQPELVFHVRTPATKSQLMKTMDTTEHRELWTIPATKTAAQKAIAEPADLTPIALATITLWMKTV